MRRWREGGQATVEAALVLPLVGLLALVVLQVAVVARDQILVTHAAREGARAAAVDPSPGVAADAALRSTRLDPSELHVATSGGSRTGERVTVTVTYRSAVRVPLLARFVPFVELNAEATMRIE